MLARRSVACGEGRTLTLLNTRMPHARTAGVYRVTRNLWVCYGVSRRERRAPRASYARYKRTESRLESFWSVCRGKTSPKVENCANGRTMARPRYILRWFYDGFFIVHGFSSLSFFYFYRRMVKMLKASGYPPEKNSWKKVLSSVAFVRRIHGRRNIKTDTKDPRIF